MAKKRKAYHRDGSRDGIALEHLPSGNWRARVWDTRLRKYRSVTKSSEVAAKEAAMEHRAKFHLGSDNAASCLLQDVWRAYKSERLDDGKAKLRTIEAMQRVVDGLSAAGAEDFKATGFRAAVTRYFKSLELSRSKAGDGRVAVSTRRRLLSQVRALLNFARSAGWLVADPIGGYSPVGAREQDDSQRETFTLSDARSLVGLNKPQDPVWVHVMLMLYAGLRESEARALTWADYDKEAGLLWIRKGKGNKVRNVPVQNELANILDTVSDLLGPTAKVACLPSSPIVRPSKGRAIIYQHFCALLASANIKYDRGIDAISGMPRRLNRHSCRHTYCAALLATGQPGDALRIVMGHGSENLTNLYGAQVATYTKQVQGENWERGRLHFLSPPAQKAAVT